jgi:hypothetical protein
VSAFDREGFIVKQVGRAGVVKLVVASLSALVLLGSLSGCAILRTLSYSNDRPKIGHKTTAKVTVTPTPTTSIVRPDRLFGRGGGSATTERPFFGLFTESSVPLQLRPGVWDPKGVLNDGKRKLVADPQLADQLTNSDSCQQLLGGGARTAGRGSGPPFKLVRTKATVTISNNETRKIVPVSLPIKVPGSTPNDTVGELMVFISGSWVDDGDNTPEDPSASGDEIECSGIMSSTLFPRP